LDTEAEKKPPEWHANDERAVVCHAAASATKSSIGELFIVQRKKE
jgi:hypothetical protein